LRDEASSEEYRMFLPRELVEMEGDAAFVWVANLAEQTAHRTPVTLGDIQTPELVEVVDGITAASRIISTGGEGLEDGDRIQIEGEDSQVGADVNPDRDRGSNTPAQPDM
jgi:hypothetical protein